MKIRFEYFWAGFDPQSFFLLDLFDSPKVVFDDSYDYLVLSVFPNKIFPIINSAKIIVFNGEHPSYIKNRIIKLGIKPHIQIGYIDFENYDYVVKKIYYPLWILYYPNFSQQFIDEIESKKNITIEEINKKKFCCLINSHDNNLTRKPIYNVLSKIDNIDCPGLLLNNLDRKLVGTTSEDKIKFMNSYIFNICSENSIGSKYVTEKLPQALNSCCIPIYYGDLSEDLYGINEKIFNVERVIQVNELSPNSMKILNKKIRKLFDNKYDLKKFYCKPIFNTGAINEYTKFIEEFKNKFKSLL